MFYLKLCLKSLKTNGLLIRTVGEMLVPYDAKKLGEITRTDINTVQVAMKIFEQLGLVQILENGEIFLTQLENMVGSETNKAQLMRDKRKRELMEGNNVIHKGNNVTDSEEHYYTEKEIEKEIELDKDKDKDIERREKKESPSLTVKNNIDVFKLMDKCNIPISAMIIDKITIDIEIYGVGEVSRAIEIADERGKRSYAYIKGILETRKAEGTDTKKKTINKKGDSNGNSCDNTAEELKAAGIGL